MLRRHMPPITFATCFSGIGAPEVAARTLGWTPVFCAEVEPFPCAVLAHHWPDVPNVGDVLTHDFSQWRGKVDVMIGGPPCQAWSIAGDGNGRSDARGELLFDWARILDAVDSDWSVTENVPGLLGDAGNAFGSFLAALVGERAAIVPAGGRWTDAGVVAGPGRVAAWRVFNSEFFRVPQRRRRLFIVGGRAGAPGVDPVRIMAERKSGRGHPVAGKTTWEALADGAAIGAGISGQRVVADPLTANESCTYSHAGNNFRTHNVVAQAILARESKGPDSSCTSGNLIPAGTALRKLTARESERCFGFPDDHTLVPFRGKLPGHGLRKDTCGNSMAVPVMRWILERIARAHSAVTSP